MSQGLADNAFRLLLWEASAFIMALQMETSISLVLLAVTAGIYLVLEYLLGIKHSPREPPLIQPKIPWVGHLIGIIMQKSKYHGKVWCVKALMKVS